MALPDRYSIFRSWGCPGRRRPGPLRPPGPRGRWPRCPGATAAAAFIGVYHSPFTRFNEGGGADLVAGRDAQPFKVCGRGMSLVFLEYPSRTASLYKKISHAAKGTHQQRIHARHSLDHAPTEISSKLRRHVAVGQAAPGDLRAALSVNGMGVGFFRSDIPGILGRGGGISNLPPDQGSPAPGAVCIFLKRQRPGAEKPDL